MASFPLEKIIKKLLLNVRILKNIITRFMSKLVSENLKSDIWILKTLAYFYDLKYDYPNELIIREKIIKLNSDDNNEKKLIENLKFKISDERKNNSNSLLEDIKHDPNNVDLHIQLVNKYINVRNFDSAIEHIEEFKNSYFRNFRLKKNF